MSLKPLPAETGVSRVIVGVPVAVEPKLQFDLGKVGIRFSLLTCLAAPLRLP